MGFRRRRKGRKRRRRKKTKWRRRRKRNRKRRRIRRRFDLRSSRAGLPGERVRGVGRGRGGMGMGGPMGRGNRGGFQGYESWN